MSKSPDAFRTISEVSEALNTPAHVLRFWESKFSQVKPVKRAGGRRYYRPTDLALLGGIKTLLHDQGMTIKGVQKLLREKGIAHVAAISSVQPPAAVPVEQVAVTAPALEMTPTEAVPAPRPKPAPKPRVTVARPERVVDEDQGSLFDFGNLPTPSNVVPIARPAAAPTTSRIFAAIAAAEPAKIRRRRDKIAPLLARLEALRFASHH